MIFANHNDDNDDLMADVVDDDDLNAVDNVVYNSDKNYYNSMNLLYRQQQNHLNFQHFVAGMMRWLKMMKVL